MQITQDKNIRRILIIKWSALGDVVISSTLFEDIRRAFPEAKIDLNTLPPWDGLFLHDSRFREILAYDLRGKERGISGTWRWLREVRRRRYDLIVDLQSNDRTWMLMSLLHLSGARIPYRMGNYARFPYNIAPQRPAGTIHAYDQQKATLQAAGILTETSRPVLPVTGDHRRRVAELMAAHGLEAGRYAIFLPGCQAAGYLKRWGSERYAALGRLLHLAGLEKVVVLGGKDEMEECERIRDLAGGDWLVNLCGETRILDIVPLCEGARVIVGNDTGTAHVASCTDRPMVVVCGPTDPARVKPVGNNVVALQATLECINCYCKKPCSHHTCMKLVTPEQVFETLRPFLTLS
jgi:heptosyltransferase-2